MPPRSPSIPSSLPLKICFILSLLSLLTLPTTPFTFIPTLISPRSLTKHSCTSSSSSSSSSLPPTQLIPTIGLVSTSPSSILSLHKFNRRALGPSDIHIKIRYSGICHSDIHTARGEWGEKSYPLCVGHEILGDVVSVGSNVTKFKIGDVAGVGCFVNSCRTCDECESGGDNYCSGIGGICGTYGSNTNEGKDPGGGYTMGGYSKDIVVDENYSIKIPEKLNVAAAAPLLCAGITCYSPFVKFGAKKGHNVGVVGLGGLGHIAVKIAKAMGSSVTVFTRQESKRADAIAMGADTVVVSTDENAMKTAGKTLHMIYNSISAPHDIVSYLNCLKNMGTMFVVGAPPDPWVGLRAGTLLGRGLTISGSKIGSIRDTQKTIDFCAENDILCDIELIPAIPGVVDEAWERTVKADVRYRFVIDTANTM